MLQNAARRPILCHRLFFAILPPPELARQVAHSAIWFGSQGGNVNPDRLHITMDILEDFDAFPRDIAEALITVGDTVSGAPCVVELDQISGSRASVALRSRRKLKGLEKMGQAIAAARVRARIPGREGYRPNPHMTLFYRDGEPFSRAIQPVRWQADEFVLVHSAVGRGQHEVLARWRLRLDAQVEDEDGQFRLL